MIESYKTIAHPARGQFTVKGSRFIGSAAPAATRAEALNFISRISEEFADATHNAFAYRVGLEEDRIEYSGDDREPAGSAGPPMLQALLAAGLDNVVVVGTRYFGGVKLGIGGLIRAYRGCAESALEAAGFIEKPVLFYYKVSISYDSLGEVYNAVGSAGGEVEKADYGEEAVVFCRIPARSAQEFPSRLRDATRGKGKVVRLRGCQQLKGS